MALGLDPESIRVGVVSDSRLEDIFPFNVKHGARRAASSRGWSCAEVMAPQSHVWVTI